MTVNNLIFSYLKNLKAAFKQFHTAVKLAGKYDCRIHRTVQITLDSPEDITLDKDVYIGAYTVLSLINYPGMNNTKLKIGKGTYIGELNNIRASGGIIIIGKKCLISQNVNIIAANHLTERNKFIKEQEWDTKKNYVVIGDDVWVGCGTTILPGVRIGTGAVIGAGSVVTKDVPEYSIAAGNPARICRERA